MSRFGRKRGVVRIAYLNCEWCVRLFVRPISRVRPEVGKGRFCSTKCRSDWRTSVYRGERHPLWNGQQTVKCWQCGDVLRVQKQQAASGRKKFCSRHCMGAYRVRHSTKKGTKPEQWVGGLLDALGVDYSTQYHVKGIGLCDLYIPSANLIVECDGAFFHHGKVISDTTKTARLKARGYEVLRIPEQSLDHNRRYRWPKQLRLLTSA